MRIEIDAMRRFLRRSLNRRTGLGVGLVAAGVVGLLALPGISGNVPMPDRAACCSGAVAVGDAMISPSNGGDKDFFEVPTSPPSAVFLLGNNESMMDFPQYLPEVGDTSVTGCSDPLLVSAMDSWFDLNSTDAQKNGSIPYDQDADLNVTEIEFFDPNQYYQSRGSRIAVNGTNSPNYPFSLDWDFRNMIGTSSRDGACGNALEWVDGYWGSPMHVECQQCLADKGWWRGPLDADPVDRWDVPPWPVEAHRKWVVSGRVLNVRPPKFVVARKVLKDVISVADNVRMGVATFGPDQGWYDAPVMMAKLRPACNYSFPTIDEDELNRPLLRKAVNDIFFNNNERSIGEALFGIGGYFSSQLVDGRWASWFQQPLSPGWGWPGGWNGGTIDNVFTGQDGDYWGYDQYEWLKWSQYWEALPEDSAYQRSVCFSCQVSSVIVLTDGAPVYDNTVPITKMMEILIANGAKHPDGTPVTFDASSPETNLNSGGVNYCDQFGVTKEDCDYTNFNWPHGLAKGNKNFMDDVAFFLANTDLRGDMPGIQSVTTHTIGYGDNSPMLRSIALAGKGKFARADDASALRDAIMSILGEIKQVSTSFSAANISGVQAGGVQSSAYVPRFVPRRGRPYEGHLYRFFYYSEFAQGCQDSVAKSLDGDPRDLNGDKDCEDTFFLDKPAGFTVAPGAVPDISSFTALNIVQENTDGIWVKAVTATQDENGRLVGGEEAVPFWDLGETLGMRSASAPCDPNNPLDPTGGRCIFTMIDRNDDGKFTDLDNPPVAFDTSNRAQLQKYLLGAGDGFCVGLFAKKQLVWTGTLAEQEQCVSLLIDFVRGVNIFGYDGVSTSADIPCAGDKTKSCKLADIFHSTPVSVEPPIDPFICTLGLGSQCLSTLYSDFSASVTSEALCSASGGAKPCYEATPLNPARSAAQRNGSYDAYRELYGTRERILLVGSNGGMLHAVHTGTVLSQPKQHALDDPYDLGTGQELWAFIPPDLLPKLGLMVNGHEYYVDGTTMVRDIWADGSGSAGGPDGVKDTSEFHTIAVISERAGGQRFLGLDVTNPRAMLDSAGAPFRWMWPNACDPESAVVGQSWSNFAPKPPPIGPVRLESSTNARGWDERWVVFLNGGYSVDLSRGADLYMLDAWTGNKLWSAGRNGTTSPGNDAYRHDVLARMMPIAAAPAMVDLGKGENVQIDMDGFFDTVVVGDLGGQVWTFRFHVPGKVDASGYVTNWFGARSLEVSREDVSGVSATRNMFRKTPFYNIASNVVQPETGWLRSFLGTGDKQNLRANVETACGPDNLLACVRLKCDVTAELSASINGRERKSIVQYDDGVLVSQSESWSGAVGSTCSASRMELTRLVIDCPDATALGTGSFRYPLGGDAFTDSECTVSGADWSCSQLKLATDAHGDLPLGADATVFPANRYYGFHSYGGWQRKFTTASEASTFDKMRVTDIPFTCAAGVNCSLVDVTIPETAYETYLHPTEGSIRYVPSAKMATLNRGETEGPGWFMQYGSLQEKTAAGSAVLGGVVLWPSFTPPASGGAVSACSLQDQGDIARTWQADVITGLPNQADGFCLRDGTGTIIGCQPNKGGGTAAPPADPTPVITLSKTGGIRFEVAMPDVGDELSTEKVNDRKNVTPDIYWLDVPRNLHECRHEGNCD